MQGKIKRTSYNTEAYVTKLKVLLIYGQDRTGEIQKQPISNRQPRREAKRRLNLLTLERREKGEQEEGALQEENLNKPFHQGRLKHKEESHEIGSKGE